MKRINGSRTLRRQAAMVFAAVLAGSVIAACSSSGSSSAAGGGATGGSTASPSSTGIKKGLVVYFIPKDTQNPYEVLADKGGEKALSERGRPDSLHPGGHPGPRQRDRDRGK
jgi:rhamnose transport system substrate-binding protein